MNRWITPGTGRQSLRHRRDVSGAPPARRTCHETERIIGTWFRARGHPRPRHPRDQGGRPRPARHPRAGKATATTVRTSPLPSKEACGALQTDYIDLYQLHWPDRPVPLFGTRDYSPPEPGETIPIEETLAVLADIVKEGKSATSGSRTKRPGARCGFSNWRGAESRGHASSRSRTPTTSSTGPSTRASPRSATRRACASSPIRRSRLVVCQENTGTETVPRERGSRSGNASRLQRGEFRRGDRGIRPDRRGSRSRPRADEPRLDQRPVPTSPAISSARRRWRN